MSRTAEATEWAERLPRASCARLPSSESRPGVERPADWWKLPEVRASRSGPEFMLGRETLAAVIEDMLDRGAPTACTGFALAREVLRWLQPSP